jgi:hypothetical protein
MDPAKDDPTVTTTRTVLVTNNISAVDRMGRMSHVWWGDVHPTDGGNFIAYDQSMQKIYSITHWFDPFGDPV